MKKSYYQMMAYASIAIGFINWDYQRAKPHIFLHFLVAAIFGGALLSVTFIPQMESYLKSKANAALLLFAFILVLVIEIL